jgi:hypothetical protein
MLSFSSRGLEIIRPLFQCVLLNAKPSLHCYWLWIATGHLLVIKTWAIESYKISTLTTFGEKNVLIRDPDNFNIFTENSEYDIGISTLMLNICCLRLYQNTSHYDHLKSSEALQTFPDLILKYDHTSCTEIWRPSYLSTTYHVTNAHQLLLRIDPSLL